MNFLDRAQIEWNEASNTMHVTFRGEEFEETVSLEMIKTIHTQFQLMSASEDFRRFLKIEKFEEGETEIPEKYRELYDFDVEVKFSDCTFHSNTRARGIVQGNFTFLSCHFKGGFFVSDSLFIGKLKVRDCTFYETNFYNTAFSDLADFWLCTFKYPTVFVKTDFKGVAVFAASTFNENVLFTYTLIDKLIIFRGTDFKKGLDLSLSIGNGVINCFDMTVADFVTEELKSKKRNNPRQYKIDYDKAVTLTEVAAIPLKNKRETFRILKQTLASQGNISESIIYKEIEKQTLYEEILADFQVKETLNLVNLFFSRISNKHGSSYGRAFFFILIAGWIFYYASIMNSNLFIFTCNPCDWAFGAGFKYFIMFLIPTHGFDYLGEGSVNSNWFYLFDFVGRVFVGYGIYQFIQSFRKYR